MLPTCVLPPRKEWLGAGDGQREFFYNADRSPWLRVDPPRRVVVYIGDGDRDSAKRSVDAADASSLPVTEVWAQVPFGMYSWGSGSLKCVEKMSGELHTMTGF